MNCRVGTEKNTICFMEGKSKKLPIIPRQKSVKNDEWKK